MRATLNISMPPNLKRKVDKIIRNNDYASVSEMFRDAVRALEDRKLVEDIMESEKDFASGRFKRLRSLKDLI
jgi:Arc/MetJ-type ribon-helix-helix transcriptional regulator